MSGGRKLSVRLAPQLHAALLAERDRLNALRQSQGLPELSLSAVLQALVRLGLEQPTATRGAIALGRRRTTPAMAPPAPRPARQPRGKSERAKVEARLDLKSLFPAVEAQCDRLDLNPRELKDALLALDPDLPPRAAMVFAVSGAGPHDAVLAGRLAAAAARWLEQTEA